MGKIEVLQKPWATIYSLVCGDCTPVAAEVHQRARISVAQSSRNATGGLTLANEIDFSGTTIPCPQENLLEI